MLLSFLIFLFYTAIFIFILFLCSRRSAFVLSFKEASLAFTAKIIIGCLYGYFFLHYYGGDDTWLYHNESLKEFALLKTDPLHFFINDIFPNGYKTNQLFTIFDSTNSFAKDLEYTLLIKLLAIFDLFTGGRYYVNVIFYNIIVFWGCYSLFKTLSTKYPNKRLLWLLFIFYFPPLLFWTSGIRKDGICFAIICGLIYQLYFLFEKRKSAKHLIYASLLFFVLFLVRNYLALSFIPICIAYGLSRNFKYPSAVFLTVVFLCITTFFATRLLSESFNLPQKMADRQHSFLSLSGNSYLPIDTLSGNLRSYCKILPEAINHIFLRPYITEANGLLYLFSFIENLFFYVLLIWTLIRISSSWKLVFNDPLMLTFICVAFLNYMIIGYTVPFLGAIVRYKSSFEIFLILVLLQLQNTDLLKFIDRLFVTLKNAFKI
jgi:hypothetical protein